MRATYRAIVKINASATHEVRSLYFVRSGEIFLKKGPAFEYAGYHNRLWTSRANSNANYSYNLGFDTGYVGPSGYSDRHYAFSLRCLSTVLDG